MGDRYQNGDSIRTLTDALFDASGTLLTALVDVQLKIRRTSDDFLLDFFDNTFKAAGHTDIDQVMAELDAAVSPGVYFFDFDTTGFPDDEYYFQVDSASATNSPQSITAIVGGWVNDLLALLHENTLMDEVVVNAAGFLTSARIRQFPDPTVLGAATPGGANGTDGEVARHRITATPTIVGGTILNTFQISREL